MARRKKPDGINALHWRLEFVLENEADEEAPPQGKVPPEPPRSEGEPRKEQAQAKDSASHSQPETEGPVDDPWKTVLDVAAVVCLAFELWA